MAEIDGMEAILSAVRAELASTRYACTQLEPLTGGTSNFVFCGLLSEPLQDGTREVLIKHGEGYVASHPSFKITTSRCVFYPYFPLHSAYYLPFYSLTYY